MSKQTKRKMVEKIISCFLLTNMLLNHASAVTTYGVNYLKENIDFELPSIQDLFNFNNNKTDLDSESEQDIKPEIKPEEVNAISNPYGLFSVEGQGNTDVGAGINFNVALREDGTVWTWGLGTSGQLGNGTNVTSTTPVQVRNSTNDGFLENIIQISTYANHTLALDSNGNVWAWGEGANGKLGRNSVTNSNLPVKVMGVGGIDFLENIAKVAAGQDYSMALDNDGNVYVWGNNATGQLGTGNTTASNTAIKLTSIVEVKGIAAGEANSYAVKTDGTAWAWGRNTNGANGNNLTSGNATSPIQINGLNNVAKLENIDKIVASANGAIALTNTKEVYSWGAGNSGDGTATVRNYPVQVKGLDNVGNLQNIVDIYGGTGKFAKSSDGTIYAWATNTNGGLSDGTVTDRTYPVKVKDENGQDMQDVKNIAVSKTVTAATVGQVLFLKNSGEIYSSGVNNSYNVAGTSEGTYNTIATKAFRPEIFSSDNGKILKIGESFNISYEHTKGFRLSGEDKIGTVTYTSSNTNVLTVNSAGRVTAVGYGKAYINISDSANNLHTRVYITAINQNEIAYPDAKIGTNFSAVLKADGTVWVWGDNAQGQLGNNTIAPSTMPSQVLGVDGVGYLENIVQIAVGNTFMLALDKNGNVYAWGQNDVGQLGQNNTTSSYVPKKVLGVGGVGNLENIVEIQAGNQYGVALDKYGKAYSWGTNASGQLGDISVTQRNAPVAVWTAKTYKIYAGNTQSFFQKYEGQVFGTGVNTTALLGDTIATNRSSTVRAKGLDGISNLKNVKDIAIGLSSTHFLLENGKVYACRNQYHTGIR